MTPQNQLSIEGNFFEHPFAELIAEISHGKLTGSLRVSFQKQKCVVYFTNGRISFAVSNARSSRIFEIFRNRGRVSDDELAGISNVANDLEFADHLERNGLMTPEERVHIFVEQITGILVDVLSWPAGEWSFDSLARIRKGLVFEIDLDTLLGNYARTLAAEQAANRFRSLSEEFIRSPSPNLQLVLSKEEFDVLSIFTNEARTVEDILSISSLVEGETLHALYSLWLTGLLQRQQSKPAFSDSTIAAMRGAKLEKIQEAKMPIVTVPVPVPVPNAVSAKPESVKPVEEEEQPKTAITLEEYLQRVESAETYYEVLGVEPNADLEEIRHAYFASAKLFHPDHYHKDTSEIQNRVQGAFTKLASAHETLKSEEKRENYNFKMRNEIAGKVNDPSVKTSDEVNRQRQQAIDSFERGFDLLLDNQHDAALPFLARAAHYDPRNARYHAYYGKALSNDEKQRHKAESEMQTAVRIDSQNPTFRIMLAEFFIQMNLLKRAEGELTRLLNIFPSNREAKALLATLK